MDLDELDFEQDDAERDVDPIEIFRTLTLRGRINDLWGPQVEALTEWHSKREHNDVSIEMATGGGKTAVGLLVAQSLLNEGDGKVLYVCPNNLLVEQTAMQADELGVHYATRMSRNWKDEHKFLNNESFCLTNYHSVFNPRSHFERYSDSICGVVFDDAHAAEDILRQQHTITLSRGTEGYSELSNIFSEAIAGTDLSSQYDDVTRHGRPGLPMIIPGFIVHQAANELTESLRKHCLNCNDINTEWPYLALRDHINLCCFFINCNRIEVSPPVIPAFDNYCFNQPLKRVYLSATALNKASSQRTFSITPDATVRPQGKLGTAQRLFVFPMGETDNDQRAYATDLLTNHKTIAMLPSYSKQSDHYGDWPPLAGRGAAHSISEFKDSKRAIKASLIARYDGVDLPGDSCRSLLIDGLPRPSGLHNAFLESSLNVCSIRSRREAARIIQACGRIFRSNTDHGSITCVGRDIQIWLQDANNRRLLPPLMKSQIEFSFELSRNVESGKANYRDLIEFVCSGGHEKWDALYARRVDQHATMAPPDIDDWYTETVKHECLAFRKMWQGNRSGALRSQGRAIQVAKQNDERYSAWLQHQMANYLLIDGQSEEALSNYGWAANVKCELGRPDINLQQLIVCEDGNQTLDQTRRIQNIIETESRTAIQEAIESAMSSLTDSSTANQFETSVEQLGHYLGLESTRPERDDRHASTLDNLWISDGIAFALESKNQKSPGSSYSTKDVGQLIQHGQWLSTNFIEPQTLLSFVGPMLDPSPQSQPTDNLSVITFGSLLTCSNRLIELYLSIDTSITPTAIQGRLKAAGLDAKSLLNGLQPTRLLDLRYSRDDCDASWAGAV